MTIGIRRYTADDRTRWNDFIAHAKNGLFLFHRDYMEYHADRFEDCSLLFTSDDKLVAVLPANRRGDELVSHGGLTFGGLVLGREVRAGLVVELLLALRHELPRLGVSRLRYKQIPSFLHDPLSQEDAYGLFRAGAELVRVDANFVIDFAAGQPALQERRLRSAKKATKAGVQIERSSDFEGYWRHVLEPVLRARHDTKPVHSCEEIVLLASRFPENIELWVAKLGEDTVAGTVLYRYPTADHAQYIASNDLGRQHGALDAVFLEIVTRRAQSKRFLSFGISTEDEGTVLNAGLAEWKEGFGARLAPHLFYTLASQAT